MALMALVTAPKEKAKTLAEALLKNRVCACVNIVKEIESFYWWQGKIDQAKESLLVIKTKSSLYRKLKDLIKQHHPYDVPEIIAFEIDKINKEYSDWLNKECR